ncbi:MAG: cytidine deaminase [Bacteroidota bacterium]|jgi:cytidine deaminase
MTKEISRVSTVYVYNSADELDNEDKALLAEAKKAVETAYAPYSKFRVGCALKLANGVIIHGSNQENVAYPSGLCAERVAMFYAGSSHPGIAIERIAITAQSGTFDLNEPVTSCGACLQSMLEYENRQQHPMRIILQGETGQILVANGLQTFMPFQFNRDELKNE